MADDHKVSSIESASDVNDGKRDHPGSLCFHMFLFVSKCLMLVQFDGTTLHSSTSRSSDSATLARREYGVR